MSPLIGGVLLLVLCFGSAAAYSSLVATSGGNGNGKPCVFPYKYKNIQRNKCEDANNNDRPWCATLYDYDKYKKWGNCLNWALNKPTSQSSTYSNYGANRAVNWNRNPNFNSGSCAHTEGSQSSWWQVEMGRRVFVEAVHITNRANSGGILKDFQVLVVEEASAPDLCYFYQGSAPDGAKLNLNCYQIYSGQTVRVQLTKFANLILCEVEVYGFLETHIEDCYKSLGPSLDLSGSIVEIPCIEESTPILVVDEGSTDFARNWLQYKQGFGSVAEDLWLGNSAIHSLTVNSNYQLRIDLWATSGEYQYVEFPLVKVGTESKGYPLHLLGPAQGPGKEGGLISYHQDSKFYTVDVDTAGTCSALHGSGWWYKDDPSSDCYKSKLTGSHLSVDPKGVYWESVSLRKVIMRLKPRLDITQSNVAHYKPAFQYTSDSAADTYTASEAVDGLTGKVIPRASCGPAGSDQWWYADLQRLYRVTDVILKTRVDCFGNWPASFVVYVGPMAPVSDPSDTTVDTTGYQVCHNHTGSVGTNQEVNLECGQAITGRYVMIDTTSNNPQGLDEVQVITEYDQQPLNVSCTWNDECVTEFSECTVTIRSSLGYNFTCQCVADYQERESLCLPVADVEIALNFGALGEIVRQFASVVNLDVKLRNKGVNVIEAAAEPLQNFNLSAVLASGLCQGSWEDLSNCTIVEPHLDTGTANPQRRLDVESTFNVDANMTVFISPDVCHDVVFLCVRSASNFYAPFVEMDPINNIYCINVTSSVVCQPPVDLLVSAIEFVGNIPITRGFTLAYPFNVTITYAAGTYDIIPVSRENVFNFQLFYIPSDRDFASVSEALAAYTMMAGAMDPAGAQRGLTVGSSMELEVQTTIHLDMDQCTAMTHLCLILLDHSAASYTESAPENNMHCLLTQNAKVCDPEITVVTTIANISRGGELVRGYSVSFQMTVNLLNANDTVSIAELKTPNTNFHVDLYLSSVDLQLTPIATATTVGVPFEVESGQLRQGLMPNASALINLTGDLLIPRSSCEDLHFICAVVDPGSGSTYTQEDGSSAHIHCMDLDSVKNCPGIVIQGADLVGEQTYATMDEPLWLVVNWTLGTDVGFILDYGDGTTSVSWQWNDNGHVTNYGPLAVEFQHQYALHGNYTVELVIENAINSEDRSWVFVVEPPLDEFLAVSVSYVPAASPLPVSFVFSPLDFSSPAHFLVWCDVDYGDNTSATLLKEIQQQPVVHSVVYTSDLPDVYASLYCFNHISNLTFGSMVILRQYIGNLTIKPVQSAYATNDSASFTIDMAQGSHVRYNVDFGDGSVQNYTDPARISHENEYVVVHQYAHPGNYTVNVTALNEHSTIEASIPDAVIMIQNEISGLSLTWPSVVPVPPGEANFSLSPDLASPAPTNPFCKWNFDGTDKKTIFATNLMSLEVHDESYVYRRDHVNESNLLNLSCSNLISSQSISHRVIVQEPITLLAGTLTPRSSAPEQQVEVSITMATGSNVLFAVQYGDGESENFTQKHLFASDGSTERHHKYTEAGNYSVHLTSWNLVSEETVDLGDVAIQNNITNLTLEGQSAVLWPPGEINLTVLPGDDQMPLTSVHFDWHFGDGSSQQRYVPVLDSTNLHSIGHIFPRSAVGLVNQTTTCSNLISRQSFARIIDIILDEVLLQSLTVQDPVLWSISTSVTLEIHRFGTGSCFKWDMGDGTGHFVYGPMNCEAVAIAMGAEHRHVDPGPLPIAHVIPFTIEMNYTYGTIGSFTVSVTAFNDINEQTKVVIAEVLDWPCERPKLTLQVNDSSSTGTVTHMLSERFSFKAEFKINCTKTEFRNVSWTIYPSGNDGVGAVMTVESPTFLHAPRDLFYGSFVARFNVSMYTNHPVLTVEGMYSTAEVHFQLVRTPLHVSMVHGEEFLTVFNRSVLVNSVDATFDPDVTSNDKSGMTFKWFCRRKVGERFDVVDDHVRAGSVLPLGGCFEDGVALLPYSAGSFTLHTGHMMPGTGYIIRVEVSKDVRYGFFEQHFFVGQSEPPVINITCRENCDDRTRYSGRIVLQAVCSANCFTKFGGVSHVWTLVKRDTNDTSQELNLEPLTINGIGTPSIFIQSLALEQGVWHKAVVYGSTPGSANGSDAYTFRVNKPPYGGSCSIFPLIGNAMDTQFRITCVGWKQPLDPLNVHFKYEFRVRPKGSTRSLLFYFGTVATSSGSVFPVGNPMEDFLNEVVLLIYDSLGDYYLTMINVTVYPPPFPRGVVVQDVLSLSSGPGGDLHQQLNDSDFQAAASTLFSAASVLNIPADFDYSTLGRNGTNDEMDQASFERLRIQGRSKLIELTLTFPVDSIDSLDQNNELLHFLLAIKEEVLIDSQKKATERVGFLVRRFGEMYADLTAEKRIAMAGDLIGNTALLMGAADAYFRQEPDPEMSGNPSNVSETSTVTSTTVAGDWINGTQRMQPLSQRQRVSDIMVQSLQHLDDLGATLHSYMRTSDPINTFDFDELTFLVSMDTPERLNDTNFKTQRGYIRLDSFASIDGNETCTKNQMLFSTINPYIENDSADKVNSPIVDFRLLPCSATPNKRTTSRRKRRSADDPNAWNTAGEFDIELALAPQEPIFVNITPQDEFMMLYHTLNLTQPVNPIIITVRPVDNRTLEVFVALGRSPTPEVHGWRMEVPGNGSDVQGDPAEEEAEALMYTLYVPSSNLTNATDLNDTLVIGVRESGCQVGKSCDDQDTLQYTLHILNSGCQSWNEQRKWWLPHNCQMEPGTTPETVKFKSNLFGGFGAGLFTPPNTIDFGTVFDNFAEKLIENMPVVGTVVAVFLIYIPLFLLFRHLDKKDARKWMLLPLVDNYQDDKHKYELHVYTGLKGNSGTNSKVFFQLNGSKGGAGMRKMDDGVRQNFQQGEISSFRMLTPESLGIPMSLHIWHDNSGAGKKADWFLSKVVIVDVQTRKWYLFMCDQWMSMDREDGRVERILNMSTTADGSDPNSLLQSNISRKLFDEHIWLSVGYRKTRSTFNRVQRLTCCLAILYLAMVTNAMWYDTESDSAPQEGISIGPISFTVHELYTSVMSSLVLLPLTLIITVLFAKSAHRPKKVLDETDSIFASTKRPKGMLPFWCRYIAWVLVSLAIATAAFFTILMSFEFGGDKSRAWLATFFLCFFESVILVQPLQAIFLALLVTFVFKSDSDISEYETRLGKMETTINDTDTCYIAPRLRTQLSSDEIQATRKRQERDQKMRTMIREMLFYVIFIVLLSMVVYTNQDRHVFFQNKDLANTFLYKIKKINSPAMIWKWLDNTVLPGLYYHKEYNGESTKLSEQRFIGSTMAMRLGPPRLRLLRVKPVNCSAQSPHKTIRSLRCTEWYSAEQEDTNAYQPGWKRPSNQSMITPSTENDPFMYQSSPGSGYWGYFGWYSGGGYMANLGNTIQEATDMVNFLMDSRWINEYTRAVFLEFNVWNPNTNLFNLVAIVIEMEPIGSTFYWHEIESVQLYRYSGPGGVVNLLTEIACIIYVTVMIILEIRKCIKQGCDYFSGVSNVLQLFTLGCFLVAFAMYVLRSLWTVWTVEEMMNNRDKITSFQTMAMYNRNFLLFFGLVAFLAQLQMLHLLRYNHTIALLATTLRRSAVDLLGFTLIATFVFLAFVGAAFLNFYQISDYSTLINTMTSLTGAFLGKFNFHKMMGWYGDYGGVFLLCYLLIMIFLVVNIFVVILNEFISAVKTDDTVQVKDHEVLDHMLNMIKALILAPPKNKIGVAPTQHESDDVERCLEKLSERLYIIDRLVEASQSSPAVQQAELYILLSLNMALKKRQHTDEATDDMS